MRIIGALLTGLLVLFCVGSCGFTKRDHDRMMEKIHAQQAADYSGEWPSLEGKAAVMQERFRKDEAAYLASPETFFSTANAIPCEITKADREVLVLGQSAAEFKQDVESAWDQTPSMEETTIEVLDLQFALFEGECPVEGKLTGGVRYLLGHTTETSGADGLSRKKTTKLVERGVDGGGSMDQKVSLEELVDLGRFIKTDIGLIPEKRVDRAGKPVEPKRQLLFSYEKYDDQGKQVLFVLFSFTLDGAYRSVSVTESLGGGLERSTSYQGERLSTTTLRNRNNNRTEEIHHAWTMANGTFLPEKRTCYHDGEEIKTTDCKVDE